MEVHVLSQKHSLINQFMAELRDVTIQQDRMRFRRNIERIGQCMALEVSRQLAYTNKAVTTPLGTHHSLVLKDQPVLATILRAGLTMHLGVLSFFDQADCAFISAYRKHGEHEHAEVVVEYLASPDLNGRTLMLIDPMLATGRSIVLSYQGLLKHGIPSKLHVLVLLASEAGVDYLKAHLPDDSTLWIGDLDKDLNEEAYIVPGLGDAGDLSFGVKL